MTSSILFSKKYFNQLEIIETHCQSLNNEIDVGLIHKFRVAVKYLRTMNYLIYKLNGQNKFKRFNKRLNKVFDKAGTIREAQMNFVLFEHYSEDRYLFDKYRCS